VQQVDFKRLAGEFAAGEKLGGGGLHGRVAALDAQLRLGVFVLLGWRRVGVIEYDGDQGFGFELRGGGKRDCRFHR